MFKDVATLCEASKKSIFSYIKKNQNVLLFKSIKE